jgi:uncharacterized membrane protein (DUF4010 family)
LLFVTLLINDRALPTFDWGEAIGIATLASIAFRLIGNSVDITLVGQKKIVRLRLVILAALLLVNLVRHYSCDKNCRMPADHENKATVLNVFGFTACILFIYFCFFESRCDSKMDRE